MTQELLNLFIEYQIPSDLLSYDGPAEASTDEKLARVKEYIAKMQEMIDLSKQRELEQEREREAMRLAELNRTPPPAPFGPPGFGPPPMPYPAAAPVSAPMPGGAPPPVARSRAMPAPAMAAPPAPMAAAPAPMAAPPPPPAPVAAAPAPPAAQAPQATASPEPQRRGGEPAAASSGAADSGEGVDYTRIPAALDKKFEALDEDGALRATIINPGDPWTRSAQKGLLGSPSTSTLSAKDQKDEKHKAFDLLDALSKSGALAIEDASLHVVIAATHCFDKTLTDTVIQANVNPIEKVERSLMIVGTTIHGRPASELLAEDQRDRFFKTSPKLGPAVESPRE